MRAALRTSYHWGIKMVWEALWPLLVWKAKRFGSNISITCDRGDGGGAQIHSRISTLAFARALGIEFLHTPMTTVHFAKDEQDITLWNGVILFDQISRSTSASVNVQKVESLRSLIAKLLFSPKSEMPVCYEIAHCHGYTDRFPDSISRLIPELKLNIGPAISIGQEECSESVIHVRGEIGGVDRDSPRRSSLSVIESKILHSLRNSTDSSVVVYTSEFSSELSSFEGDRVSVDYSTEVFGVLKCMVRAQNLYLAKSSLSYVAGILSSGLVHYESFWHPRLDHWVQFPK
jgi:hypothetical protein